MAIQVISYNDNGKQVVDKINSNFQEGVPAAFDASKVRRNLRVCHWNVGHFNMGIANSPSDSNVIFTQGMTADEDPIVAKFRNKIRQISADVMLMCEWYNSAKSNAVFSDFPYSDTTHTSGDFREYAIKSNFKLESVEDVHYTTEGITNHNFKVTTIKFGNKWTIALIECHLYYTGSYNSDKVYRAAMMEEIIDYVEDNNYDRVVICGDFNNGKPNDTAEEGPHEYDVFLGAGYRMLNCDILPRFNTYPATGVAPTGHTNGFPNLAIDNIIVKGMEIVGAQVIDDGTLTDHCGLVCDLTLL